MPISVSRETLYTDVWAEPMTTVASRYGVSSSFLVRVCSELNVPRPQRGYWAKLAHGKGVERPALPESRPGDLLEWTRGRALRRVAAAVPEVPAQKRTTLRTRHVARDTPHELVTGATDHFLGGRRAETGHLRPAKRRLVDLYVSEAVLERALAFASMLFVDLESRGHQVTIAPRDQALVRKTLDERKDRPAKRDVDEYRHGTWAPNNPTVTFIRTIAIALTIFEESESVEVRYVDGKWIPIATLPKPKRRGYQPTDWTHHKEMASGRLCVRASSPYGTASWTQCWAETEGRPLESSITSIVKALEAAAPVVAALAKAGAAKAAAEHREWERQRAIWEREEAERQRERRRKESREQLAEIIVAWASAKAREDFFEDLERRSAALPAEELSPIRERIDQARALLGGTDILRRFTTWRAPEN